MKQPCRFLPVLAVTTLFVSACQVTPDYSAPATASTTEDVVLDAEDARFSSDEPVINWWREFDDPLLADVVEIALQSNNDLQVAVARVREARALLGETELDRLPTVTSSGDVARQRLSDAGVIGPVADRTINNYQAGFDAFWELDLFGQVANRIEGVAARSQAAQAGLQAAIVTIAAETARAYMDLRGAQYAFDVAERNAANQQQTLQTTQRLQEAGRASELDVARAKTQLDLTRSNLPRQRALITSAINRLGVLTTRGGGAIAAKLGPRRPLPSIPEWVNVGDASSLIRRRPDVREAERNLAAATADYGVAVASLYPSVSLLGNVGFQSVSAADFGSSASTAFSIGPSINWPAFNLGRVRAQIRQSDARAQAALAQFEQQVLLALEETQTALSNFAREDERRATLYEATVAASEAARIARLRYDRGLDDFLDVLDAQRVLLEAESLLAESETTVATNLVAVYKALGGGWQVVSAAANP